MMLYNNMQIHPAMCVHCDLQICPQFNLCTWRQICHYRNQGIASVFNVCCTNMLILLGQVSCFHPCLLCLTFSPSLPPLPSPLPLQCGRLQLFDLSSNSLLEEIPAHEGAVWGVSLFPDKRGVATGSADHTVKFWEFELVSADDSKQKGKRWVQ